MKSTYDILNAATGFEYGGSSMGDMMGSAVMGTLSGENWLLNMGGFFGFEIAGNRVIRSGFDSLNRSSTRRYIPPIDDKPNRFFRFKNAYKRNIDARGKSAKGGGGLLSRNKVKKLRQSFRNVFKGVAGGDDYIRTTEALTGHKAGTSAYNIAAAKKFGVNTKRINLGMKLKGVGSIIGFAPFAFMAFDAVANALQISPQPKPPVPIRTATMGGNFIDTSLAYTQRRRALQAIHDSQYGGRSAFGHEANSMHS